MRFFYIDENQNLLIFNFLGMKNLFNPYIYFYFYTKKLINYKNKKELSVLNLCTSQSFFFKQYFTKLMCYTIYITYYITFMGLLGLVDMNSCETV